MPPRPASRGVLCGVHFVQDDQFILEFLKCLTNVACFPGIQGLGIHEQSSSCRFTSVNLGSVQEPILIY
jgi:hypothetical protein